jgi:hypothetical protein
VSQPAPDPNALTLEIVSKLVEDGDLGARPWEHFTAIAFLGEGLSQLNGYAYVAGQAPFPAGADDFRLHADLRRLQEATTGPEGQRWDVAVVQVEAATRRFRVRYVYSPESLDWRVTPATFRRIAEAARPTAADFA